MKTFQILLAGGLLLAGSLSLPQSADAKKNFARWHVNSAAYQAERQDQTRVGYYRGGQLFSRWVRTSDKKLVDNKTGKRPGTIIIDTKARRLYYTLPNNKALSYGIGVGRPGYTWAGYHRVTMKKEWPSWTPPASMLKRQPDLPRFMKGGPKNPLGARALYLGSSIYRIHGTNNHASIGHAVSSGCIRMHNNDVKDLYKKVNVGTPVYVR